VTVERVEGGELDLRENKWTIGFALLALFVSVATLIYTLLWNSSFGQVLPLEPTGFAIIRGIDPAGELERVGPFPSDHVVLPLEWTNNSGTSVLIKEVELVFSELGQPGEHASEPHKFFLVGTYDEISAEVLTHANSELHTFKNSLIVQPHETTRNVLVFRESGWGENDTNFRFRAGEKYQVDVEYRHIQKGIIGNKDESRSENLFCELPMEENVKNLGLYGKNGALAWDY